VYIVVPIVTDDRALADEAIERLQALWPDWMPNDGDLEVVVLEQIAAFASDAADSAAQVPDAVFVAIAEELHGIQPRPGIQATSTVTFTTTDGETALIPAGTEVDIDGWAFTTDVDATADPSVAGVIITAVVPAADANGLTGDLISMLSAITPVTQVSLDEPTAGGSDEESLIDFRDRAVLELQLQATTLTTTRDYELMALTQTYVGRVLAISDWANRQIVLYVVDPDGVYLTTSMKNQLLAFLNGYRETNWVVSVVDPQMSDIDVTYAVVIYPGSIPESVIAACDDVLENYLDPAEWGQPLSQGEPVEGKWLAEPAVRVNKIIDILGSAPGVNYVKSVTLAGTNGTVQGNGDFLMNGVAPLARLRTPTGTATFS
jgi:hypothetical protein